LALEQLECQRERAMPTYVYRFLDSGDTIEVQQSFSDDALTEAVHPADGVTRPVKKVFTPVGITFKGSGFYKTDSRSGSTRAASKNGADSGGSSSKSESASAASSSDSSSSSSTSGSSSTGSSGSSGSSSGSSGSSDPR
jgi:predicted nucleic acid-binding Zn ribbon protein